MTPFTFSAEVIIKVFPKPTMFKASAIRGRWYGFAGDPGHSVHLVSVQVVTPGGMLTHRVVRARNIGFMDAAQ